MNGSNAYRWGRAVRGLAVYFAVAWGLGVWFDAMFSAVRDGHWHVVAAVLLLPGVLLWLRGVMG